MDFFERWFHVSPDGGNGSLELLYALVIVAVLLLILFRHRLAGALTRYAPRSAGRGNRHD